MDTGVLREAVTDAIRYWERRRIAYNAVLTAVVLIYFGLGYPASRAEISIEGLLGVFLLAVVANVAYCAAYIVDIFVQMSGYRQQWRRYRPVLFAIGALFAGIITHYWAMAFFLSPSR